MLHFTYFCRLGTLHTHELYGWLFYCAAWLGEHGSSIGWIVRSAAGSVLWFSDDDWRSRKLSHRPWAEAKWRDDDETKQDHSNVGSRTRRGQRHWWRVVTGRRGEQRASGQYTMQGLSREYSRSVLLAFGIIICMKLNKTFQLLFVFNVSLPQSLSYI